MVEYLAIDTETTGLDLRHGAEAFMVTMADSDNNVYCWEMEVNPKNRKVVVNREYLKEIQETIDGADWLVFQNPKFDVASLKTIFPRVRLDWWRIYDTLMAGHLLASNHRHDLTSMCVEFLGVDIGKYDDAIKKACNRARALARSKEFQSRHGECRIAKEGLKEMPSAKGSVAKMDMWLPRAIATAEDYSRGECRIVNLRKEKCDQRIDRTTKWGNPFHIGKDGSRAEVIEKYRRWITGNDKLLDCLPELDGKTLGCFCKPEDCHGDVLKELLTERVAHPWWTVCSAYATMDAEATLALFRRQKELIEQRGLWRIYEERLKLLPVIFQMESYGITLSGERLDELLKDYRATALSKNKVCTNIAVGLGHELELPKAGNNNSLLDFAESRTGLNLFSLIPGNKKKVGKSGRISLNRAALEGFEDRLSESEPKGKRLAFLRAFRLYRKVGTAVSYMESYHRFRQPIGGECQLETDTGHAPDWFVLYPSLNPTGTHTLRWSSNNPNEQNISKQEGFNLRYCFGPAPGREWWSLDAKNIELRIPAYESGEQEMIDLFENDNNGPYYGSYHMLIFDTLHPEKFEKYGMDAKKVFASTWYQWTKNGNFAVQYGAIEASGTADRAYHIPGAQRRIQQRFRNLSQLNTSMIQTANRCGYVETIPDRSVDPERGYPLFCTRDNWGRIKPTVPLNYHVQGTAMWWMMKAMLRCSNYLNQLNNLEDARQDFFRRAAGLEDRGYYMVMQVHDELVFDFPASPKPIYNKDGESEPWRYNLPKIRKIKRLMEQGGADIGVNTPVSIEYHPNNWSEGIGVK